MLFFFSLIIIISALITSFIITYVSIPTIIIVARTKQLYDEPDERTAHNIPIPTLGGLAIFTGMLLSMLMWISPEKMTHLHELKYIVAAIIIIFFVGLKDDILITAPLVKFYGQLISATILAILADIRVSNLHGFFGIDAIPYSVSIVLTVLIVIVLINSFNFIDGIDGLSSGVGVITAATFGIWFYIAGHYQYAIIAAALVGGLISFFKYNVFSSANKIFMGDTGSLILGLVMSILVIKFVEFNINSIQLGGIHSAPSVAFGVLIIPLFDMLRIIFIRVLIKKSPFMPDKNHIHHRLLSIGLSHRDATFVMLFVNLIFIAFVFNFQFISIRRLLLIILLLAMVVSYIPSLIIERRKKANLEKK